MSANRVPTAADPTPIALAGGGTVYVRRLPQSVHNEIIRQSNFKSGDDPAGAVTYSELVVRWGVVRAEGCTEASGNPIANEARTKVGKLGGMFSIKIYDLIAEHPADLQAVLCEVTGTAPDDDEVGGGGESVGGLDEGQVSD